MQAMGLQDKLKFFFLLLVLFDLLFQTRLFLFKNLRFLPIIVNIILHNVKLNIVLHNVKVNII